jgi:hypothetical protein
MHGEQRFSDAAERWGRAALLQHAPSHAYLSNMLVEGRPGVAKDEKRGFELAAAGEALGCAHSKGALGRCYVNGWGVAEDVARGLKLSRESAAAGSCFGQFVVGKCYNVGLGVAKDDDEAVRWYRLAADQGLAIAQYNLGVMYANGRGVAQNDSEIDIGDKHEAMRLNTLIFGPNDTYGREDVWDEKMSRSGKIYTIRDKGFLATYQKTHPDGHITENIWLAGVSNDHRRQGVYKTLLQVALGEMTFPLVSITTSSNFPIMKKWVESIGFESKTKNPNGSESYEMPLDELRAKIG